MDFKQLTYRQKNIGLLAGTICLLLLSYLLSFSKTIEVWESNKALEQKLMRARNAPELIDTYKQKLITYNRDIGVFSQDSLLNQEFALSVVSSICEKHKLVLKSFPTAEVNALDGLELYTTRVEIEGDFKGLLQLVYELEQVHNAGRIASVNFQVKKDRERRKEILVLALYLQNIKKSNHEKDIIL